MLYNSSALRRILFFSFLLASSVRASTPDPSYLQARRLVERALATLGITGGSFAYTQDAHSFYHSSRPLQTYEQRSFGRFMLSDSGRGLLVADTIDAKTKIYPSYVFLSYS